VGKITNKTRSKPHHSHSYAYGVYNRQALQVLQQIFPYLLSYKSARCALVLSDYLKVTPRNGKYSSQLMAERQKFENKFLNIKP
jgi:hypothetical protein